MNYSWMTKLIHSLIHSTSHKWLNKTKINKRRSSYTTHVQKWAVVFGFWGALGYDLINFSNFFGMLYPLSLNLKIPWRSVDLSTICFLQSYLFIIDQIILDTLQVGSFRRENELFFWKSALIELKHTV